VGWALFVWFVADLATSLLALLAKDFVESHQWTELLVFDSTLVIASILLLHRDNMPRKVAGICSSAHPFPWFWNVTFLIGLNTVASVLLLAAKAPNTMLSSLSTGQNLVWVCVFAPLSEELFTRGWFQSSYLRAGGVAGPTSAILASATLFAAMHLFVSTSLLRNAVTVVAAFLSGLIYGRVRQASNSLFPVVIMHSVFNAWGWFIVQPIWFYVLKR
jgi:membrane protease YdiL (CAAX protease family)